MNSMRCLALLALGVSVLIAEENVNNLNALRKANHYADLYNLAASRPFFLIADQKLPHGSPDQIHAHLGYLRATMETRSLPELSNELASILHSSAVGANPRLRLWCLGIKGDVDGEMDSASARADWESAHRVAIQIDDKKGESRSVAEAGFVPTCRATSRPAVEASQRGSALPIRPATLARRFGTCQWFIADKCASSCVRGEALQGP